MSDSYQGPPISIVAYTRERVITVMAVGDSITNGTGNATTTVESGVDIAVRTLQREGVNIDVVNMGHSTQASDAFFQNGILGLDYYRPTIAFFATGTPNDTGKYVGQWFSTTLNRAVRWIAECRSRDIIPGLLTMPPAEDLSAAFEAERRRLVAATLELAANAGIPVIDRSAVWSNASVATGGYIPGLGYDTLHPSNAGYIAESAEWEKLLRGIRF